MKDWLAVAIGLAFFELSLGRSLGSIFSAGPRPQRPGSTSVRRCNLQVRRRLAASLLSF